MEAHWHRVIDALKAREFFEFEVKDIQGRYHIGGVQMYYQGVMTIQQDGREDIHVAFAHIVSVQPRVER